MLHLQVPAAFAGAYFGAAEPQHDPLNHNRRNFSMPSRHASCEWPEGKLTCRVLEAGARLQVLRVATRLEKFTNWGSCPTGQSTRGLVPAWLAATRSPVVPSHICHPDAATVARAREITSQEVHRAPNLQNIGYCAPTPRHTVDATTRTKERASTVPSPTKYMAHNTRIFCMYI